MIERKQLAAFLSRPKVAISNVCIPMSHMHGLLIQRRRHKCKILKTLGLGYIMETTILCTCKHIICIRARNITSRFVTTKQKDTSKNMQKYRNIKFIVKSIYIQHVPRKYIVCVCIGHMLGMDMKPSSSTRVQHR